MWPTPQASCTLQLDAMANAAAGQLHAPTNDCYGQQTNTAGRETSNPYAVVFLQGTSRRTAIAFNRTVPHWDEGFTFEMSPVEAASGPLNMCLYLTEKCNFAESSCQNYQTNGKGESCQIGA